MPVKRIRTKACCHCEREHDTLFRVRVVKDGDGFSFARLVLNSLNRETQPISTAALGKVRSDTNAEISFGIKSGREYRV